MSRAARASRSRSPRGKVVPSWLPLNPRRAISSRMAEGLADRAVVGGIDRAVLEQEVRGRCPTEEVVLAALDAEPAAVVEHDEDDRRAEHRGGRKLLHRLEEVAVAGDSQHLPVRL